MSTLGYADSFLNYIQIQCNSNQNLQDHFFVEFAILRLKFVWDSKGYSKKKTVMKKNKVVRVCSNNLSNTKIIVKLQNINCVILTDKLIEYRAQKLTLVYMGTQVTEMAFQTSEGGWIT